MSFRNYLPRFGQPLARSPRQPQTKYRFPKLRLENLEERLTPVVGANAVPDPVMPGTGFDGVVRLNLQNGSFCSGSLMFTGRHVLTAAHCLTDDNGVINQPTTNVVFQMAAETIIQTVPQANYWIHGGWDGTFPTGNDVAILPLLALAPSGPGNLGAGQLRRRDLDAPALRIFQSQGLHPQVMQLAVGWTFRAVAREPHPFLGSNDRLRGPRFPGRLLGSHQVGRAAESDP